MTIINHECYVSLEVAKLLKAAGFDWEVSRWYEVLSDGQVMYSDGSTYNWNNPCYGESTFSIITPSDVISFRAWPSAHSMSILRSLDMISRTLFL